MHNDFQKRNILFLDTPLVPAGGGQISLLNIVKNLKSFNEIPTMICWGEKDFVFDDL